MSVERPKVRVVDCGFTTRCHVWQLAADDHGYGVERTERGVEAVHRVAWRRGHGEIPPGYDIHHRCRVKRCCNVDHLELTTKARHQQVLHGSRAKRTVCKRGHALTPENVQIIHLKSGTLERRCRTCARLRDERFKRRSGGRARQGGRGATSPENTSGGA